jgi:hypothetical protein
MGADTFIDIESGASMGEAFYSAVEQAQWDFGHAGYTGTIAEKGTYIDLTPKVADLSPDERLRAVHEDNWDGLLGLWETVNDKWGPAGGIELEPGRYVFFGWASS